MQNKNKRVNPEDCIIGELYHVQCGIWNAHVIYCGHCHSAREYTFTFGPDESSWINNFNIVACKSRLKVYMPD